MERHTDRWMERQTDTGRQTQADRKTDKQTVTATNRCKQAENGKIINSPAESGYQATNFAN